MFVPTVLKPNPAFSFNTAEESCADKSLARPGRKEEREKILSFIYPIYKHNWRNISTIYIYNKNGIKRNILTIKKIHREVVRAKDLSAPR